MELTFSIIVPVYNCEKYLSRCLDSIRKQTYQNFECILIDDGSEDGSSIICENYKELDNRFYVIHQTNCGVSIARNKGIKEAKGDWICFVDSDDWIDEDYLECIHKSLDKADVLIIGYKKCSEDKLFSIEKLPLGYFNGKNDYTGLFQAPWTKIVKREILNKNLISFPEGYVISEDLYFSFLLYFYVNVVYVIDYEGYNYYINPVSAMNTLSLKKINQEKEIVDKIEMFLAEKSSQREWKNYLNNKKINVRNRYLAIETFRDYKRWRELYKETNMYLIMNSPFSKKIVYLFLFFKFDFIVDIIMSYHDKLKEGKNG